MNKFMKLLNTSGLILLLTIFGFAAIHAQPQKQESFQQGKVYDISNASPQTIDEILKKDKVVLEVYRPTCPVCIAFKKKGIYPKLAKNMPDISFVMVDVDKWPGVKATPTFIFFRGDDEITRFEGYVEYPAFERKIRNIFAESQQPIKQPQTTTKQIKGRQGKPLQTR